MSRLGFVSRCYSSAILLSCLLICNSCSMFEVSSAPIKHELGLSSLKVNVGTLVPDFRPDCHDYTISGLLSSDIDLLINAKVADSFANIQGDGPRPLLPGGNQVTFVLTNWDKSVETFTLTAVRPIGNTLSIPVEPITKAGDGYAYITFPTPADSSSVNLYRTHSESWGTSIIRLSNCTSPIVDDGLTNNSSYNYYATVGTAETESGLSSKTTVVPFSVLGNGWRAGQLPELPVGNWEAVAYGNNRFVALGSSGYGAVSTDGRIWNLFASDKLHSVFGFCYGDGKFIAVGLSSIAVSTNGTTWENVSAPIGAIESVAYGNGKWVAVGSQGFYKSLDGYSWSSSSAPIQAHFINFSNGYFFSSGISTGTIYSSDGDFWSDLSGTINARSIAYTAPNYGMVDGGSITTTSDFSTFTKARQILGTDLLSVSPFQDNLVVVARIANSLRTNYTITTSDTKIWRVHLAPVSDIWQGVAIGNNKIVAIGYYGNSIVAP